MQDVDHLVMTTDKRLINPIRLRDVQVEGSDNEYPTLPLPVGDTLNIPGRHHHRHRAPGEVVGHILHGTKRDVKVADRLLRLAVAIAQMIATVGEVVRLADRVDLYCAVGPIT